MKTKVGGNNNVNGRGESNPAVMIADFGDEREELVKEAPTEKIIRRKKVWAPLYPEMNQYCTTMLSQVTVVKPVGNFMPEYVKKEYEDYLAARDAGKPNLLEDLIMHDDLKSAERGVRIDSTYVAVSLRCNLCNFETELVNTSEYMEQTKGYFPLEGWYQCKRIRNLISKHLFIAHGVAPIKRKRTVRTSTTEHETAEVV